MYLLTSVRHSTKCGLILAVSTDCGGRSLKPSYIFKTVTRSRLCVRVPEKVFEKFDVADVEFLLSDWCTEQKKVCRSLIVLQNWSSFLITGHLILLLL